MEEEYYESPEEREARFEKELGELEDSDSLSNLKRKLHKFWERPTDIGAKYLWLQYTK